MIKLEVLTKYYKKHARGILDVSLEIKKGEIFGFIGPNGAGKSTTVRTLLNLIFPTSGTATVDGLDVVADTIAIRKMVGYIPSEVNFYDDMYVKDFIRYSCSFHGEIDQPFMDTLVEKLELDLSRKIEDLSFGNKKKVAIVAALVTHPKILILDEPTSGLDPLMQSIFFQFLEAEKKNGTTIFFSSHNLSEVQRICDRVGIIKEGRLIKVETVEDIMKTRAKTVRLKTEDEIKPTDDMINFEKVNGYISFVYTAETKKLIQLLSTVNVIDVTITEPALEEIFMHYYEREDQS
ncbi:MAG: ABC transporter ATP-binding protein [Acholeplasmataceae bacterium]|jgi:ABC-2 type transport system ATP-binding protein|nr:ABC transporter ATP-binding protein [Acholeplasmataceae bacterium]